MGKTVAARNARPHSPSHLNSTLNRPMASQGGTRYEDRTMGRGGSGHNNTGHHNYSADSVQMENLSLYNSVQGPGGGRMYPAGQHMVRPGEPVYAQVNRDKKRSRGGEMGGVGGDYGEHAHHWLVQDGNGALLDGQAGHHQPPQGGDSWV